MELEKWFQSLAEPGSGGVTMAAIDRLRHQELVEIIIKKRPDDRIDFPVVIVNPCSDIYHLLLQCHAGSAHLRPVDAAAKVRPVIVGQGKLRKAVSNRGMAEFWPGETRIGALRIHAALAESPEVSRPVAKSIRPLRGGLIVPALSK